MDRAADRREMGAPMSGMPAAGAGGGSRSGSAGDPKILRHAGTEILNGEVTQAESVRGGTIAQKRDRDDK